MYKIKITLILGAMGIALVCSGCSQSKDYSIYNAANHYAVGNDRPINYPSDMKLRKAHSPYYYVRKSSELPRPLPSLLPPDSKALLIYTQDEDRIDMPYYERFPKYPMPK